MNSFPSKKHLNTDFVEFRRKKLKKTYSVNSISKHSNAFAHICPGYLMLIDICAFLFAL